MDDIVNRLLNQIDENTLLEKAIQTIAFWASEDEVHRNLLLSSTLLFKSHKFCFKSSVPGYPYFESTFDLVKDGEEIGRYTLISSTSGESLDDFFEIY